MTTIAYNAYNQVTELENQCVCGFLISDYKYTYDNAGLISGETAKECLFTSEKDYGHKGGARDECYHEKDNPWQNQNPQWETTQRTFTYDADGQLTECRESKSQFDKVTYTYKYDQAGNCILAKKQKLNSYLESWQNTYAYNADNQMTEATICEGNLTKKYTFTYDANGNMTAECYRNQAEVRYQYDTENRLTAVYDPQKLLVAMAYDGDGNRAFQLNYNPAAVCGYGKNVSGEVFIPEHNQNEDGSLTAEGELYSYICSKTGRAYDLTEYVNDINRTYTETLTAYTINSGARESYTYAGNRRVSRNSYWIEARSVVCDQMHYYLNDGRGSVTGQTWYNGMVTHVYQYDPYGQVTLGSTERVDFYGYNAESYNPNTGLEYLRARYYNASKGRFFQEDTYLGNLTDPLTLNRYAYVKNSPLNYIDPSGHWGSSYAASYQGDSEDYNPIPSYAASHDSYGNGVPEVKSSGFSSALEEAMDNAAEIGKATKRYCDSYVAGMRVSAYVKDAELENILIMLIPFKEPISEAEMNARINEILDEVKDFDYAAFRDGMIDGELLHYRACLYMANCVDNMMGSMFAGSGTYVATAVTPDGYLIEVEVVGELVSEAILEGAIAGAAAGVLAIENGYEGVRFMSS